MRAADAIGTLTAIATALLPTLVAAQPVRHADAAPDPRLRELRYDPQAVVTVPVKRGVVTLVVLDEDEAITELGTGLGGDCSKPDAAWCIAAQAGGRTLFVKPRAGAAAPNTVAVVTDRRSHAFRFVVLADGDARAPVYRLVVKAPARLPTAAARTTAATTQAATPAAAAIPMPHLDLQLPARPRPEDLIAERLQAAPLPVNTRYTLADGKGSEDIVPAAVFDDGRFTYLRFPGNREVPAVFHVLGDGSETLVNTRMEDDLLVVDRVSRHLMLRAGQAVVGIWNEAFDLDGTPPAGGTTVPGVQRQLKPQPGSGAAQGPSQGAQL